MTDSKSPPIWVDTRHLLHRMLSDVTSHPRIAVDTESNSLHAFRERVCLIQFSTPRHDYVVDPLTLKDLSPLAPVFKNPRVEKIFHAAEYDLLCLRRDFGFSFINIFDTMQAARVLGYSSVGLDTLLADKFHVKVDKRHQKADWGARPLTPAQIDYARHDTHYLFALRDLLEMELREKGRLELALEDFARACRPEESKDKLNGSSWRRFSGRKDLNLRELTILAELCQRRDAIAERLDRPPFKVIDDNLLLAIARNPPEMDVDLAALGLSPRQERLWGGEILAAYRRGTQTPLLKRDQPKRPSDAVLKRLEKLKTWRKKIAQELKVESDIVLPKIYLNSFAENPPTSIRELETVMAESPWRAKTYGAEILALLGA
jgi:ribonuclease D